ncbi:hypothetical protein Tco_1089074 [Tanacetum coccineum]
MFSVYGGLPPLEYLSTLLSSLLGASSNSTTLSLYLRVLRDPMQRTGASDVFLRVLAVNVDVVMGGSLFALGLCIGVNVEKPGGPTNGTTDCGNMDTIRLRWGSKSLGDECWITKPYITCDNTNRNTTLSEAQGMSLRITFDVRAGTRLCTYTGDRGGVHDLRWILGVVYHDPYLGGKALVERKNMVFDLTQSNLCPSFVEDLTTKGIIGSRSLSSSKGRPSRQRGGYVIRKPSRLVRSETTSTGTEELAECKASTSNLRRIQVKDIVKEVEDHLKTYSSVGMDISTVPPIPPPLGVNAGNAGSPNRVDMMPTTNDTINTTTTTNVAQSVVDENLPQLLDSRGGSHVTNVPAFDKEDFTR